MRWYRVQYWSLANDDGDPDEVLMPCDHVPRSEDVEAFLQEGVRSLGATEDMGPKEII